MPAPAISAHGLGKRYRIGQVETGYRRLHRRVRGQAPQEYSWALRDVSFEIREGDAVGIIGRNGAGKSTLLKLLARITEPSAGYADVYGRVAALLEVGTGFHGELTGRENVFLNGAILGMNRAEVRRKFGDIVEFAGVEKYIDTPVKWYSSGMYVRLGFAVAAYLEPDILVVDEVLAVGDAEFQKRCLGRMSEVAHEGRTVLFVSHNMQAIRRLCEKAVLLEKGHLVADGDAETVVRRYLSTVEDSDAAVRTWHGGDRPGDAMCRINEVKVTGPDGVPSTSFFSSRPITVTIDFDLAETHSSLTAGFDLMSIDGSLVFRSYHTDLPEEAVPALAPGRNVIRATIPPGLLNSGRFAVNLRVGLHWSHWIAHLDDVLQFDVIADHGESLFLNDNSRPGLIAPILGWEAVDLAEADGALARAASARPAR